MTKHKMTLSEIRRQFYPDEQTMKTGDTIEIIEENKIVDLSGIVGTNIPMLMRQYDSHNCNRTLFKIDSNLNKQFVTDNGFKFDIAEFDTSPNNWVAWHKGVPWYNGECPVPEGVKFKVQTRGTFNENSPRWTHHMNHTDIISFRITGLKPGWVYPWEV